MVHYPFVEHLAGGVTASLPKPLPFLYYRIRPK